MKHINHTCRWLAAAVCASTLLLSGCIQENLLACYKLTLKAENAKGDDVTEVLCQMLPSMFSMKITNISKPSV